MVLIFSFSYANITCDINNKIHEKMGQIERSFTLVSNLVGFLILLLILEAIWYWWSFIHKVRKLIDNGRPDIDFRKYLVVHRKLPMILMVLNDVSSFRTIKEHVYTFFPLNESCARSLRADCLWFSDCSIVKGLPFSIFVLWTPYLLSQQEDHDNRYVTDRVKQLDSERRNRKKLSLMPLRKKERHHLIDIRSLTLSRSESKTLCVWLIFWFLFVLFGAILCVVDGGLHFVLGEIINVFFRFFY